MTNYIISQTLKTENGNQIIVNLENYFDLPSAKARYDKIKNSKKNIPLVFNNQILVTELLLINLGNLNLKEKNKDYERKEMIEKNEVYWNGKNDEIQK